MVALLRHDYYGKCIRISHTDTLALTIADDETLAIDSTTSGYESPGITVVDSYRVCNTGIRLLAYSDDYDGKTKIATIDGKLLTHMAKSYAKVYRDGKLVECRRAVRRLMCVTGNHQCDNGVMILADRSLIYYDGKAIESLVAGERVEPTAEKILLEYVSHCLVSIARYVEAGASYYAVLTDEGNILHVKHDSDNTKILNVCHNTDIKFDCGMSEDTVITCVRCYGYDGNKYMIATGYDTVKRENVIASMRADLGDMYYKTIVDGKDEEPIIAAIGIYDFNGTSSKGTLFATHTSKTVYVFYVPNATRKVVQVHRESYDGMDIRDVCPFRVDEPCYVGYLVYGRSGAKDKIVATKLKNDIDELTKIK